MQKKTIAAIFLFLCVPSFFAGWVHVEYPRPYAEKEVVPIEEKVIVPYQTYFKRYAPEIGWDWQMLAAVAYHESGFKPNIKSPVGACGLMQLIPSTARNFGVNEQTIWDPEANIHAGVRYIKYLQEEWSFINSQAEQTKFVLASYNVGPGSVFAARKRVLAKGGNANLWSEVAPYVSHYPRTYVEHVLKTTKKYHNDCIKR